MAIVVWAAEKARHCVFEISTNSEIYMAPLQSTSSEAMHTIPFEANGSVLYFYNGRSGMNSWEGKK